MRMTSGCLKKRIVRQEALMERGRKQEGGSSDERFFRMNFFALTGCLRLKMQKIHRVNLVRLYLLKPREIIERH